MHCLLSLSDNWWTLHPHRLANLFSSTVPNFLVCCCAYCCLLCVVDRLCLLKLSELIVQRIRLIISVSQCRMHCSCDSGRLPLWSEQFAQLRVLHLQYFFNFSSVDSNCLHAVILAAGRRNCFYCCQHQSDVQDGPKQSCTYTAAFGFRCRCFTVGLFIFQLCFMAVFVESFFAIVVNFLYFFILKCKTSSFPLCYQ